MTSEIRANTLKNRVGLGTVSFTNTGPVVSGIVTANSFSGPISGTTGTFSGDVDINGDLDVDGHTNLDNVSIAGVSTFSGILDATNTPASIRVAQDIQHKGDADTKITFPAADTITAETAGNERIRITSDGKIGINQTSPQTGLHINQDWVNSYGSISVEGSANALVGLGLRSNGNYRGSLIWRDGSSGNYLDIATYGGAYPILFRPNGTERLRIDGNGVITAQKSATFGNTSDSFTAVQITSSTSGISELRFGDTTANAGYVKYEHSINALILATDATERLRITSTGAIKLNDNNIEPAGAGGNVSTTYNNAAWEKIVFDASYNTNPIGPNKIILQNDAGGAGWYAGFGIATNELSIYSGGNTVFYRGFNNASAINESLRIDANGDINLGNNPTNQYGYKLNIQDSAVIYAQTASSGGLEAKWHLDNSAQLMTFGTVSTDDLSFVTTNVERLRISSGGGHKITCNVPYIAANLTECNDGRIALNINQTRSGQTKGIALGAIGAQSTMTSIQCYDTSNNSANVLSLNPLGGRVGVNVNGTPSAQFEVANDSTTGQLHVKHGWASRRFFSLPIINNEARWYKIVNYAAGNMLVGSLQIYTTRQGGFNQTKGYNEWKVSYVGYSNTIYGTGAENSSFYAGTATAVDIVIGDSPQNVYIKVPGSIYSGYVYMIFEGIMNNWQLDSSSYLTSAP